MNTDPTSKSSRALTRDQQAIAAGFYPLVWKIANRFYRRLPSKFKSRLDVDDLFSEGAIGLCYAVRTYRQKQGKPFKNWAWSCVQWHIAKFLERFDDGLPGAVEVDITDKSLRDYIKEPIAPVRFDLKDEFDALIARLNPIQQHVVTMLYRESASTLDVAGGLQVTHQYVSLIRRSAIARLKEIVEAREAVSA